MASGVRIFAASAVLVISGMRLCLRMRESSGPADFLNPRIRAYGA